MGSDVIEVGSGTVAQLPTGIYAVDSSVSPDGRYVLATDGPWGQAAAGQPEDGAACAFGMQRPLANRTYLVDRQTGNSRLLLDCDAGFFPYVHWLPDGRHFEAQTPACWACDGGIRTTSVGDTVTGTIRPLSAPGRAGAAYSSPDGTRFLVVGKTLRLVRDDGTVVWEQAADPGRVVSSAAWAPDGQSYVFITSALCTGCPLVGP